MLLRSPAVTCISPTMPLEVDFPKTLLEGAKRNLARIRHGAWAVFALTLLLGLVSAAVWKDAVLFSRVGSLGVVIGIALARWRFLVVRKAEQNLERALRNPHLWGEEAIRRQFPQINMRSSESYQTLSREDVRGTVEDLASQIDELVFRDEAAIIIISTLVWGYGDLLLQHLPAALPC